VRISYLDRIAECNDADLGLYLRWYVGDVVGGFVRRDRWADIPHALAFDERAGRVQLRGSDFAARTAALEALFTELVARGQLQRRGELYPVARAVDDAPLLQLDRGAVAWFGVRPFGVHLTGYVRRRDGLWTWVAVRARDKPTWPGFWDNTVAGGQPIGLGLRENLLKECAEEAAIPRDLAARAPEVATITYLRDDPLGLKPDTLFCYDLELPDDFVPQPADGEVEQFLFLPAREVADVVRDTQRCKPNCNLVWIDFFLRHGVLDGELTAAERQDLRARLQRPLP
jgi:isopentenyldiphosphate isomerase